MSTTRERNEFRRQLYQIEHDLLVRGTPSSAAEVDAALLPLAMPLGEAARTQVLWLSRLAAGANDREGYLAEYGCAGVRRFLSSGGVTLYMMSAETFPDHVNNLYLISEPGSGGGRTLTLFDAGSQFNQSLIDLRRARDVLDRVYREGAVLDQVRDVVISHGHIDHFGGVQGWREQGARVHIHPFDLRVLTRFDERVVEAGVHLRVFLAEAGCSAGTLSDLLAMNLAAKQSFAPVPVDRELCDGDKVNGWPVCHVPGHCPGQVMMQVEDVLLTADHLLARITPHQSPESITPWTGLDHYLLSLDKTAKLVREQGIRLALGGHEEPILDPAARVGEIAHFHHERLAKVRDLCQEEKTIAQLSLAMFGQRPGYGQLLALEETAAHVEYQVKRGRLGIANVEDLMRSESPAIRYKKV